MYCFFLTLPIFYIHIFPTSFQVFHIFSSCLHFFIRSFSRLLSCLSQHHTDTTNNLIAQLIVPSLAVRCTKQQLNYRHVSSQTPITNLSKDSHVCVAMTCNAKSVNSTDPMPPEKPTNALLRVILALRDT